MTPLRQLADLCDALSIESSRLKKRALIASAVAGIAASSTQQAGLFCLYLAGQPFAESDPRKLNTGGALLSRVLKQVSGCSDAALSATYRKFGDLGSAAADLLPAPSSDQPLTLSDLADIFAALAASRGTAPRSALLQSLLRRCSPTEAKYLFKLMLGDMRIGVKQSLIEEAIAVAAAVDVADVRHAVMLEADLARAVAMAFTKTLSDARMRLFHPLGFMLASPVETPEEAIARFTAPPASPPKPPAARKPSKRRKAPTDPEQLASSDAAEAAFADDIEAEASTTEAARASSGEVQAFLEDKYDGMRAQLHCGDPSEPHRVAIYSRNREDITESFPDIVEAFAHLPSGTSVPIILDGELLGWDFALNKALPFAILGQRIGRKRVDDALRRQVPVIFMAFDLLYEDGDLLLARPLRERRARLQDLVARIAPQALSPIDAAHRVNPAQPGLFTPSDDASATAVQRLMLSPAKLVESAEEIDRAYADARARANEGVMLKAAGSVYLPGRRGLAWAKLKRELATLDVVITGAEFGHGRRAGLLSDYTFAVRDDAGNLLNVGKAYSGVTDAEIAELTEWLTAHTVEDFGHFRTVEPIRVLEVAFNNIMRSDRHASGFSLRFPRILRIRDDKPPTEIDTLRRVEEIYTSQPDKAAE